MVARITRRRGRDIVRDCRTITVRIDHQHAGGMIQTWMHQVSLTRNARINRDLIRTACRELRGRIRDTAILC